MNVPQAKMVFSLKQCFLYQVSVEVKSSEHVMLNGCFWTTMVVPKTLDAAQVDFLILPPKPIKHLGRQGFWLRNSILKIDLRKYKSLTCGWIANGH